MPASVGVKGMRILYAVRHKGEERDADMQEWAKKFYLSPEWRRVRDNVFKRDFGLCVRCGAPGEIVHHKTHLTPRNINDPFISLNPKNLETLCRECHAIEHEGTPATDKGLMFDANGDLIKRGNAE